MRVDVSTRGDRLLSGYAVSVPRLRRVGSTTLQDMARESMETRRGELMRRLEALNALVLRADAFQAAATQIFERVSWPAGNAERRRDMNRISCYLDELSATIEELIAASREAVTFATRGSVSVPEAEPLRRSRRASTNLKGEGAP